MTQFHSYPPPVANPPRCFRASRVDPEPLKCFMSKEEIITPTWRLINYIVSKAQENDMDIPPNVLSVNESNVREVCTAYMIQCNSELVLGPMNPDNAMLHAAACVFVCNLEIIMKTMATSKSDEVSIDDLTTFISSLTSFLTHWSTWVTGDALSFYITMRSNHATLRKSIADTQPEDLASITVKREELAKTERYIRIYEAKFQNVRAAKIVFDNDPDFALSLGADRSS